jgi:hypothetical protein
MSLALIMSLVSLIVAAIWVVSRPPLPRGTIAYGYAYSGGCGDDRCFEVAVTHRGVYARTAKDEPWSRCPAPLDLGCKVADSLNKANKTRWGSPGVAYQQLWRD